MNATEILTEIIQRTTRTNGTIEDAEKALMDIREHARKALAAEDVSVFLDGESGCYRCGFRFERDGGLPGICPNCRCPVIYID